MQANTKRKGLSNEELQYKLDRLTEETEDVQQMLDDLIAKHQLPGTVVPSVVAARRAVKTALQHMKSAQILAGT